MDSSLVRPIHNNPIDMNDEELVMEDVEEIYEVDPKPIPPKLKRKEFGGSDIRSYKTSSTLDPVNPYRQRKRQEEIRVKGDVVFYKFKKEKKTNHM